MTTTKKQAQAELFFLQDCLPNGLPYLGPWDSHPDRRKRFGQFWDRTCRQQGEFSDFVVSAGPKDTYPPQPLWAIKGPATDVISIHVMHLYNKSNPKAQTEAIEWELYFGVDGCLTFMAGGTVIAGKDPTDLNGCLVQCRGIASEWWELRMRAISDDPVNPATGDWLFSFRVYLDRVGGVGGMADPIAPSLCHPFLVTDPNIATITAFL